MATLQIRATGFEGSSQKQAGFRLRAERSYGGGFIHTLTTHRKQKHPQGVFCFRRGAVNNVRTIIQGQKEYIYIPNLENII